MPGKMFKSGERFKDWTYCFLDIFGSQAKKEFESQRVIIEEALTGDRFCISLNDPALEMEELSMYDKGDGFYEWLEQKEAQAREACKSLGPGIKVGKLFSIPVADGYATYVVTKLNKKTADIEWRGYCPDRYRCRVFGYGGRFDRGMIEQQVKFGEPLFG
jgi:hypothetical protein